MLQNYSTNRRQIQINQYTYAKRKNTIFIFKLFFLAAVSSIITALISKSEVISIETARSIICGIFLIFLLAFIVNWYKNNKRSTFYWNVRDFDKKTKDN